MDTWNNAILSSLYSPLQGRNPLRVLRLEPGARSEPIICQLIPTNLEKVDNAFFATSYTWGPLQDPQQIQCNSLTMTVQKNAFDLLADLRLQDQQPRPIWIDAICINQGDLSERVPDDIVVYGKKTYLLGRPLESDEEKQRAVSIVHFLNRSWFSRIWVQQEGSVNRNTQVVCGTNTIDWHEIFALGWIMQPPRTTLWPDYMPYTFEQSRNNLMATTNIQIYKVKALPLSYNLNGYSNRVRRFIALLLYTQQFAATDPRDKIFALSGLHLAGVALRDDNDWVPKADYTVPWEVLYTNVTLRNLEKGWLNTRFVTWEVPHPRHLDYICANCSDTYMNGDPATEAYKLTIISASDHDQGLVDTKYTLDNWDSWLRWLGQDDSDLDSVSQGTPVLNGAIQNSGVFRDFRFAITKHGCFCLVPSITQVKGRVAVLTGYMATIALRPWQDEYLELLGDAYIHGMMINEAPCIVLELDCKADSTHEQRERILRDLKRNNCEAWRTLGIGDYTPILDTLGKRRINFV
ncbi:hypothetical protein N0V84_006359 [Fusarium piperis]|uniref:Heterokaryon incompatibility domain-containing protein n=1 Tax=Fusarium piperis TaxID=1435070 RepID=A0A9W8WC20_9HYPO|nr:hypothetical protein N0V84_006359 [Fusarium piperis]